MKIDNYACAEVLDVLDNMDSKFVDDIPKNFLQFLRKNASENYQKHVVPYIDLKKQNLNKETLNILAIIHLKCWTKSETHADMLLKNKLTNTNDI